MKYKFIVSHFKTIKREQREIQILKHKRKFTSTNITKGYFKEIAKITGYKYGIYILKAENMDNIQF